MKTSEFANAFRQASQELAGKQFVLRGRGHCPRASLANGGTLCKAAREAVAEDHYDYICGSRGAAPRAVFPMDLINLAASKLGTKAEKLIGRTY